jgi:hypothetical protein
VRLLAAALDGRTFAASTRRLGAVVGPT